MDAGHRDEPEQEPDQPRAITSIEDLAWELRRLELAVRQCPGHTVGRRGLARKLGVSSSSLYAYLKGTTLIPGEPLLQLLRELGASERDARRIRRARDDLADPPPAVASNNKAARSPGVNRPGQLPGDVPFFTGRAEELSKLDALLDDGLGGALGSSAVVISVIAGAGGMGKTALAVHWAHRFPDGQLYVNLRGHDPRPPLAPADALDQFLRALGTAGEAIPTDVEARACFYRSLLVDRRMLVVLDNAATSGQVRPLLPNTPGCAVIVTSRSRLSGLVARDGARRIGLDQLAPAEATTLLREIIGPERTEAEPEALRELALRCAGLPLAVRIAAERVAEHPYAPLVNLAGDLACEQSRLDVLAADDDETTAVRSVFSWSYHALPDDTASVFRLLALHPGPTISTPAAAAAVGATSVLTRRHLNTLADAHLLTEVDRDRYQFHDLLRDYAGEQATLHDSEADRGGAIRRLLGWYLHTAHAAHRLLYPQAAGLPIAAPPGECRPLTFDTRNGAMNWCDREYANLTAATRAAAEHGFHDIAAQLPLTLAVFLGLRFRCTETHALCTAALAHARQLQDPEPELWLTTWIGTACVRMARCEEAVAHHRHQLTLARNRGDPLSESAALFGLGLGCLRGSGLRTL